jgi:hypothetical protein
MITFELSKVGWNTTYLQYDPTKYAVEIEANGNMMTVVARSMETGKVTRSFGAFHRVSIRTSPVPSYVGQIEIWN